MIAGSSIVAGGVYSRPAAMSRMVARRILPERVFGRRATTRASRKQAIGPDAVAHERDELVAQLGLVAVGAGLEHHQSERQLAAQLVGHAEDRAFGDVGMGRDDLLHGAGREPVAGDVDDVVGAPHHEQVAVLVEVPAVAGQVPAGIAREIRR